MVLRQRVLLVVLVVLVVEVVVVVVVVAVEVIVVLVLVVVVVVVVVVVCISGSSSFRKTAGMQEAVLIATISGDCFLDLGFALWLLSAKFSRKTLGHQFS